MRRTTLSERVLVLAPRGRDAAIAVAMLGEAGLMAEACASLPALLQDLDQGAAIAVMTEEALATADLGPLSAWIEEQEEWSDFPFVLLTNHGGGIERNPAARRYLDVLGNATFIERPFHPTTLISLVKSALRGRRRQYQARARLEALRREEGRLQFALEAGGMGAWELELSDLALTSSSHCKTNFGFAETASFTYDDLRETIHDADRERQHEAVRVSIATREDYDIEYRIIRPDTNELRWLAIRGRPSYAANGAPLRMGGVSSDITERKHAEAALRESEARYRTLFNSIDAGFCTFDMIYDANGQPRDYRFVETNPAFERHTGLSDAVGRTIKGLVPSFGQHWIDLYGQVARSGEPVRLENEALGRWYDVYAFRIGAPADRRVAALFNDISQRRRAELELRVLNETLEQRVVEALAERKVFADIVEGTDAFVQVVDLNYRWLAINRAAANEFESISGLRPQIGDCMLDLLANKPEHKTTVEALWARALKGEEFTEIEAFGEPEQEPRSYEMKYNSLRNAAGELIGAYQFAYDVTQRVRDQAQLMDTQEQLRQSQKMEAVGQLTGGVAHDFNNLLTIVKSAIHLLRRPQIPEERKRLYMDAIADTVERAAKITGQLLAFARRQALKPEIFDGAARIRSVTDMLGTVAGSRIQIITVLAAEPCLVEADTSQFETALVNMAANGRDAMNEEGVLTITAQLSPSLPAIRGQEGKRGRFIAISVSDTGAGIPPDQLPHIFEPFYTTKEVGKGTGLGLSQVYGFAKQSGGDIAVQSEPGKGTTFTLYLPQSEHSASQDSAPEVKEIAQGDHGQGLHILVVEDNADVGAFSSQLLRDLGYETTWAADAREALELLGQADHFHAVFSDVVMPGMSGIELGQEIRRRHPGLPVVLTSGYSHVLADKGRHGFELLQKPYAAEDLSRVLKRVRKEDRAERRQNQR